ncbi:MAG TPA: rRNA maturation RNase YbeY [Chitinophagaceae bacterium]|nr:rRNA maturation RNase YbeY [Chitinophagaceae bacterium]
MTRNPPVYFFFNKQSFSLPNRRTLKSFIISMFKKENVLLGEIRYVFCSDKELLRLNKQFLNHDYLTDIITFDFSNDKIKKLAEVYISIDRVRDNSKIFQVSFSQEIHRVIFHGVLHLCGYSDKSKKEKAKMTEKENFYLKKYFT